MTRLTPLLALMAAACAGMPAEGTAPAAEPRPSAIRETIRLQLESSATEPMPAPTPGAEAARMSTLPPLPAPPGGTGRSP